jgi:hypothetical protein
VSRAFGPEIHYHCANDCRQEGCPGHAIREVFDRSTDIYIYEIDGKPEYYFDENELSALLKAHEAAKGL